VNRRGLTLLEVTLALGLTGLLVLAAATLTGQATALERALVTQSPFEHSAERLFDWLEETLLVGDHPGAARVEVKDTALVWTDRQRGLSRLAFEASTSSLVLEQGGQRSTLLGDVESARFEASPTAPQLLLELASQHGVTSTRTVVLR
jgi:hypothetical protein